MSWKIPNTEYTSSCSCYVLSKHREQFKHKFNNVSFSKIDKMKKIIQKMKPYETCKYIKQSSCEPKAGPWVLHTGPIRVKMEISNKREVYTQKNCPSDARGFQFCRALWQHDAWRRGSVACEGFRSYANWR